MPEYWQGYISISSPMIPDAVGFFSKRQASNLSNCEENLKVYFKCILKAQKQEGCII